MRKIIFSFPLPVSALQEISFDRVPASLPNPPKLFLTHHCSAVRDAVLQRTLACAHCKRAFHKLRAACLRKARQKVFRRASRADSQLHANSNCTYGRWPSSKDRAPDNKELRHLNVEDANLRPVFQRQRHCLFTVTSFEYRLMRRKVTLEYLAQVSALGHIVFGN